MKKKATHRAVKVPTKKQKSTPGSLFLSRSILIIGGTLGVLTVALINSRQEVLHAVQGTSIVAGIYNEAVIPLPNISGAAGYNIYYTQESNAIFTDAVRNVAPEYAFYTISYLKRGTNYKYKIAAIDATGKEYWFSPITIMTNLQGM